PSRGSGGGPGGPPPVRVSDPGESGGGGLHALAGRVRELGAVLRAVGDDALVHPATDLCGDLAGGLVALLGRLRQLAQLPAELAVRTLPDALGDHVTETELVGHGLRVAGGVVTDDDVLTGDARPDQEALQTGVVTDAVVRTGAARPDQEALQAGVVTRGDRAVGRRVAAGGHQLAGLGAGGDLAAGAGLGGLGGGGGVHFVSLRGGRGRFPQPR